MTQPFLSFGDANWYSLAPGQRYDNFAAGGWVLTGGAKIVPTRLFDGTTGYVLDLPSGAQATSPPMCVTNDYPTARAMVKNVVGFAGVAVGVRYLSTSDWAPLLGTGALRSFGGSWSPSGVVHIHPSPQPGWQLAQFTLVGAGTSGEYQIYNFYVDPRMI